MRDITLILGILTFCASRELVVRQNVIFQKLREIPTTQNNWRITLIDDLSIFVTEYRQVLNSVKDFEKRLEFVKRILDYGQDNDNQKGARRANPYISGRGNLPIGKKQRGT